jgi:anti-sigma factor RsiW
MSLVKPLACKELAELVTDYFEGSLDPTDRARFDEHLDACPDCVVYVDQMRRTLAAVGRLTVEDVSPEARQTLLDAFRDWKSQRASGSPDRPPT